MNHVQDARSRWLTIAGAVTMVWCIGQSICMAISDAAFAASGSAGCGMLAVIGCDRQVQGQDMLNTTRRLEDVPNYDGAAFATLARQLTPTVATDVGATQFTLILSAQSLAAAVCVRPITCIINMQSRLLIATTKKGKHVHTALTKHVMHHWVESHPELGNTAAQHQTYWLSPMYRAAD